MKNKEIFKETYSRDIIDTVQFFTDYQIKIHFGIYLKSKIKDFLFLLSKLSLLCSAWHKSFNQIAHILHSYLNHVVDFILSTYFESIVLVLLIFTFAFKLLFGTLRFNNIVFEPFNFYIISYLIGKFWFLIEFAFEYSLSN
jgi:hypothetical protein